MTLADSLNLARRLSVRNEAELLQEPYGTLTKDECEVLSAALQGQISKLPKECRQYVGQDRSHPAESKKQGAKKDSDHADPFAGLPPGEAAAAKAARVRGRATHAVLQRRLTNTHRPKKHD